MEWFLAIVALCLVIIVHEFGHYIAAVSTGMKVDRFSVFGIGPVVVRLGTWRGTEFVISAIPFGAYVMVRGMEPEPEDETPAVEQPREVTPEESPNFRDKPLLSRFLVLFGGPAANYVCAMLIFFGVYTTAGAETVEIGDFAQVSAAREAGLQVGDQLVRIGEESIDAEDGASAVLAATDRYLGQTIPVVVDRGGQAVETTITLPDQAPALGITMMVRAAGREVPIGDAAVLAVRKPLLITQLQLSGLYRLITGQMEGEMTGPVGIVKFIKRSAEAGAVPFLMTAAFISTLLGMFNLLPLPALDGGRIMFLGYEAVTRRPASPRMEGMVHGIGMLALLVLIAIVTVGDLRGP